MQEESVVLVYSFGKTLKVALFYLRKVEEKLSVKHDSNTF